MILTPLFVVLAAVSKAVADTLADHFWVSIFKKLNPKFWDKATASDNEKTFWITKYKLDGWHIANSLIIIFFLLAMVNYQPHLKVYFDALYFILSGIAFNIFFNLFYNRILKSENK